MPTLYILERTNIWFVRLDERLFTHADKFIPERWTTKKELTKDSSLFVPFSIGNNIPKSRCFGKLISVL